MYKIKEDSREDISERGNTTSLLQMQEVSVLDIQNRDSMDLDKDSVAATRRTPNQEFGSTEE